jgi:hypothetical protein
MTRRHGLVRAARWRTAAALAVATGLLALSVPNLRCIRIGPDDLPADAVAILDRSGARGNLAVHFDWGEYVIWRLAPRIKVSIDGRRETVYSQAVRDENMRFMLGIWAWDALLVARDTGMALVHRDFPTFNLLKLAKGWSLVHEDKLSGLFVRDDSPHRSGLVAAAGAARPAPAESCFPGPAAR